MQNFFDSQRDFSKISCISSYMLTINQVFLEDSEKNTSSSMRWVWQIGTVIVIRLSSLNPLVSAHTVPHILQKTRGANGGTKLIKNKGQMIRLNT